MNHIKWPEITSFHNVRKLLMTYPELLGSVLEVSYRAKIKLHGTNAAVQLLSGDVVQAQSRTNLITVGDDNAGFARWVETNKNHWLKNRPLDREVIVFGEWCGPGVQKGVAISQAPNKIFVVFAAQDLSDQENLIVEPQELEALTREIPDVYVLPWYGEPITVAWLNEAERLQPVVEEINSRVELIEKCDPWVKSVFGVEGLGEGLVFYPLTHLGRKSFSDLCFKAKGEKHKTVNVKAPAQVNPEAASSAAAFAELVLTEARLEQGARAIVPNGELVFDLKTIGKFLGWVGQDVSKECQAELEASNLEWKIASRAINDKARAWYLNRCKTL